MHKWTGLMMIGLVGVASLNCGDDTETESNTSTTSSSSSGVGGAGGIGGAGGEAGSTSATGGSGGVGMGGMGAGGGQAMSIPDPGNLMDSWSSMGDIGTPGMAWPVGTATQQQPYIEGVGDAVSGNAFFVFRAGPALTTFTANVFGNADYVHLHDGAGAVFGDELVPTASTPGSGTWVTVPGEVYVLEVHQPGGGFF